MTNSHAGQDNSAGQRNLAAVRSGLQAWAAGTGSPFDLVADDAALEITGNSDAARIYSSRAEFLEHVIVPLTARMSTRLIAVIRTLYRDGGTVIALFDAEGMAHDN